MRIEFLRLGKRPNINWQIDVATDSVRIPLLTLQPLLENAVYHGIQPLPEGGTITVSIKYMRDSYTITVANPVPAEDLSQPVDSKYPSTQGRVDGSAGAQYVSQQITIVSPAGGQ